MNILQAIYISVQSVLHSLSGEVEGLQKVQHINGTGKVYPYITRFVPSTTSRGSAEKQRG